MSLSKIIALDLGKFKTVCCVMDAATRESTFETVQTSPSSLHGLIVKQLPPSPADALVVFETCDLAGWVHDLCQGLGVRVIVTHANGEAWLSGGCQSCCSRLPMLTTSSTSNPIAR